MCYFCPKVSDEIGILLHTIETHDACSIFSMRKYVFDEKIGCNAYRSLHFPVSKDFGDKIISRKRFHIQH